MATPLSIAMAQINPIVGDLVGNSDKIFDYWKRSEAAGKDLVVFPELCLCGYPPEDLVLRKGFLDHCANHLNRLAERTKEFGCAAIIGAPDHNNGKTYNAAFLVHDGQIKNITRKHHLPNYEVFDEIRTFASAPLQDPVAFKGHSLGLMICEDLWFPDVAAHLKNKGAEHLIVINGSPFTKEKDKVRKNLSLERVKETGLPLIYVNQIGGQDELVFDGGSFALDEKGKTVTALPVFEEALSTECDHLCDIGEDFLPHVYGALQLGIRDYVDKNNFPGVLIGLSGGVDSALAAVLAVDALGAERVEAVLMPSRFSSKGSIDDAQQLASNLGIKTRTIPIAKPLAAFEESISGLEGLAHENIQSRIRGNILMALSNMDGKMVLSTGNKSEMAVGYSTLYGDMNGGFNALKDVYKTEVYALCRWRNTQKDVIPQDIITKVPSAELKENQSDQDSLPDYETLDTILECLIEEEMGLDEIAAKGYARDLAHDIWCMLDRAEYKRRQACPGVKITKTAFGRNRRYPITNRFAASLAKNAKDS